jgi:hypothetical protein
MQAQSCAVWPLVAHWLHQIASAGTHRQPWRNVKRTDRDGGGYVPGRRSDGWRARTIYISASPFTWAGVDLFPILDNPALQAPFND